MLGKASVKESFLELARWLVLAPIYAAAIPLGLAAILSLPLMLELELLFEQQRSSEGISQLFQALYIGRGLCLIAGGIIFFLAVAPALSTGVAKIVIDRVVENPKHRNRWMYVVVVPISTLAWFYFLIVFPRDFSFTGSYWGRPAYSWMIIFVSVGLFCCWLMLRRKPKESASAASLG